MKRMDFKLENIPAVVATCVVLRSMCEMYGDNFCDEWAARQSAQSSSSGRATNARNDSCSAVIRNAIKDYLKKELFKIGSSPPKVTTIITTIDQCV